MEFNEPAGQQQSAQVILFAPTAIEPTLDVVVVEVEVSQLGLTDRSALVEMITAYEQGSNDSSASRIMPTPSAAQNQPRPSPRALRLAKAKRKKNR